MMIPFGMLTVFVFLLLAAFQWCRSGVVSASAYRDGSIIDAGESVSGLAGGDDEPSGKFTIVTYNMGYASGLANNTASHPAPEEYAANLDTMIRALDGASPDILALQEVDYDSRRSHFRNQSELIADRLQLRYRANAYNWNCRHVPFPYFPLDAHFGRVVSGQSTFSRFPVSAQRSEILPKPPQNTFVYNALYPDRLAQAVRIDLADTTLTVMNVHLEAYRAQGREAQARTLARLIESHIHEPLIVLGDFNAVPPWATEHISAELNVERGDRPHDAVVETLLNVSGLETAIPESSPHHRDGPPYTFRSDEPRVAIDHIFVNRFIECGETAVLGEAGCASDHLPVRLKFRIRADA